MEKIGQGSAKDLFAHPEHPEHLFFQFSDRVSVFDYGALPEGIPGRGSALFRAALAFEKILKAAEISTAFDPALSQKTGLFSQRRVRGGKFGSAKSSLSFLPVEIIFRYGVTPGSSLLRRRPELKAYERFSRPLIEFTTKLESSDRLLDSKEAQSLLGATPLEAVELFAKRVAEALQKALSERGLELWDGKIECAVDEKNGEILLVDALTPDELRVTLAGLRQIPLSKELLRQWLGATEWAFAVKAAKSRGENWREGLPLPPRLGPWRTERLASLYESFAEVLEGQSAESFFRWARGTTAPKPRVAVLGGGGREAALRWRLEREGAEITLDASATDAVLVSMDQDLASGKVDELQKERQWTFGPQKKAARAEWSKAFGRELAQAAAIPLPRFSREAKDLRTFSEPPVVKLDGLAAGKGVVVPESWEEAEKALAQFASQGPVLLEERLRGFEASAFFYIESGYEGARARYLGSAQDFKRRFAGDSGPNTGGMGAYAPHPKVGKDDIAQFQKWAEATARVLAERDGVAYHGVLYLGLLKDERRGWTLLEYNARFGDPETQALVLSWPEQTEVLRSLLQLSLKTLPAQGLELERPTLCLSLVRPEYPGKAPEVFSLPEWNFRASTEAQLFRSQSLGGRVAYLVAAAPSLPQAGDRVFEILTQSPWKNLLEWRADLFL